MKIEMVLMRLQISEILCEERCSDKFNVHSFRIFLKIISTDIIRLGVILTISFGQE